MNMCSRFMVLDPLFSNDSTSPCRGSPRHQTSLGVVLLFRTAQTDPPLLASFVNAFCPFCRQDMSDRLSREFVMGKRKHHAVVLSHGVLVNKQLVLGQPLRQCIVERAAGRGTRHRPREP